MKLVSCRIRRGLHLHRNGIPLRVNITQRLNRRPVTLISKCLESLPIGDRANTAILAVALAARVDRKPAAELIGYAREASQTLGTAYAAQLQAQTPDTNPTTIEAELATNTATENTTTTTPKAHTTPPPTHRTPPDLQTWAEQLTKAPEINDTAWNTFTGTDIKTPFVDTASAHHFKRKPGPLHLATGITGIALLTIAAQADTAMAYSLVATAATIWVALVIYLYARPAA